MCTASRPYSTRKSHLWAPIPDAREARQGPIMEPSPCEMSPHSGPFLKSRGKFTGMAQKLGPASSFWPIWKSHTHTLTSMWLHTRWWCAGLLTEVFSGVSHFHWAAWICSCLGCVKLLPVYSFHCAVHQRQHFTVLLAHLWLWCDRKSFSSWGSQKEELPASHLPIGSVEGYTLTVASCPGNLIFGGVRQLHNWLIIKQEFGESILSGVLVISSMTFSWHRLNGPCWRFLATPVSHEKLKEARKQF